MFLWEGIHEESKGTECSSTSSGRMSQKCSRAVLPCTGVYCAVPLVKYCSGTSLSIHQDSCVVCPNMLLQGRAQFLAVHWEEESAKGLLAACGVRLFVAAIFRQDS